MAQTWQRCCLNVPLNEQGIKERESFAETDWPNVFNITFTWDQYDLLDPIFLDWNDEFDLLIDFCESEKLPAEKTREAVEILELHMREREDEPKFIEAAEILKTALLKAIKLNMPLYLDF